MSAGARWRIPLVSALAVGCLAACGSEPGPEPTPDPSGTQTSSASSAPSVTGSPTPSPTASTGSPSAARESPSPTGSLSGLTLRQLGFENGPLDEFSLPSDVVITTSVDQPNAVTLILSSPSPATVEAYLRATLPELGFTIDVRATEGQAMRFRGNGWTGGFTGTGATSAVVLRPA
jgi:hypothetical protein